MQEHNEISTDAIAARIVPKVEIRHDGDYILLCVGDYILFCDGDYILFRDGTASSFAR